ncbi:MAG: hypothetical protein GY798_10720 [Hyphomicrobiales bacterium]|nr:hypothetical protein [Hyphomicrobiales bacterium]
MPTQSTYVLNSAVPGIEYAGAGLKWTVADDVFVGSVNSAGVSSTFTGSKLVNKGEVFSATGNGVEFFANNGTILNKAKGSIFGDNGIVLGGAATQNMTVINHGSIDGYSNRGVSAEGISNFDLYNTGEIHGHMRGVHLTSPLGPAIGPMIENTGEIRSEGYGIYISMPGLRSTILNKDGGTIEGDDLAIFWHIGKGDPQEQGQHPRPYRSLDGK